MDALLGDWNLNIAKSKFEPQPPMKKYTMKVIDTGADHLLIKSDWIEADGTAGHVEYSTAFDGKIVERELETISADGKTFRELDQGKDAKGKKYKNHLVFERP